MVWKKACRIHSECHRSMPLWLMSPLCFPLLLDPPFVSSHGIQLIPTGAAPTHPFLHRPGLSWACGVTGRRSASLPPGALQMGQLALPRSSPSVLLSFPLFLGCACPPSSGAIFGEHSNSCSMLSENRGGILQYLSF